MKGEQYIKAIASSASTSKARATPSCDAANRRPSPREVSETELWSLLGAPIVQTVLGMGVDLSRVKQAIKRQIRATGQPFSSVDSLLEAAIEMQHHSEHRQALENPKYASSSFRSRTRLFMYLFVLISYETVDWESVLPSSSHHAESRHSPAENTQEETVRQGATNNVDEEIPSGASFLEASREERVSTLRDPSSQTTSECPEDEEDSKNSTPPTNTSHGADRSNLNYISCDKVLNVTTIFLFSFSANIRRRNSSIKRGASL